jgi:6,7-dimethyl-8-ribityllumazine synthase
MDLSTEYCLALGNGIITCENEEQAWARANKDQKNKGGGAAQAALQMLTVKEQFGLFPR